MMYIDSIVSRAPGILTRSDIVMSGTGSQTPSCFILTGTVVLRKLYGVVTSVTTLTNCTATSFALNVGGTTVQLTKNDGVLSGVPVGTVFAKLGLATATMAVINPTVPVIAEPAAAGTAFSECLISAQNGSTTTLYLFFTTTDGACSAAASIFAEWVPLGSGTLVAV